MRGNFGNRAAPYHTGRSNIFDLIIFNLIRIIIHTSYILLAIFKMSISDHSIFHMFNYFFYNILSLHLGGGGSNFYQNSRGRY